jgi:catechol 2,3-dioxygenase
MNVSMPQPTSTSIDPRTTIGDLSLTVADLDRSIAFYTGPLGFSVLHREGDEATLGVAGTPLLRLTSLTGARPWPGCATGLYHFAILLPTRADLGRWLRNWLDRGNPLPGQGDHLVSEAFYLSDPDGNGIEVYRDRPRSEWQWEGGRVQMDSLPIDINGVLAAAEGKPWEGFPSGTTIGHMHLQVGDIPTAAAFYVDTLGFDVVAEMPTALFISAGGYHHHLGMNIWHSRGAKAAPEGTAGLRDFTIVLPDDAARHRVLERVTASGISPEWENDAVVVRDPWGTKVVLKVA